MKYSFRFPRVDAENIIVEADTFGEAADEAVELRIAHATPTKLDGEIYEQKPTLTNPAGAGKQ